MARVDKNTPDEAVLELIRSQRQEFTNTIRSDKDGEKVPTAPPNIKAPPMKTNIIDAVTQYEWIPDRDDQEVTKAEKMKIARKAAMESGESHSPWRPANPMPTNIIDAVENHEWIPDRSNDDSCFSDAPRRWRSSKHKWQKTSSHV